LNIKEFKCGFRFTDEKYALLSEKELSEISIIPCEIAIKEWIHICKEEVFQRSKYIKDIVNHTAPVLIKDCFWGDNETHTKEKLLSFFKEIGANKVSIYYDNETALNVSLNVFCTRWSDFCYPSDLNLIIASSVMIVYYEDIVYGPYEI
jgi:hypothetical protein